VWNGFTQTEEDSSPPVSASANTAVDTITDKLFLPTEREMFGSRNHSNAVETATNQGRFAYYANDADRKKYNSSSSVTHYWEASPFSAVAGCFCSVYNNGGTSTDTAVTNRGCAPVFCVK
jgi:hypothetical protein